MMFFWVILVFMLLLAMWFVAAPLIGVVQLADADRNKQNILLAKEQLTELEKEHTDAVLSDEQYQQQKSDLQKALLSNVTDSESSNSADQSQKTVHKLALLSVLILMPSISIPTYLVLASPAMAVAGNPHNVADSHSIQLGAVPASMDQLVKKLVLKLQQNPDDIKGWKMLGRTYMSLRQFDDAADVYAQLYRRVGDETAVLLSYADALLMSRNGKVSGMPFQLILTALKQEPNNKTALWLAGLGYAEQTEYEQAIKLWQTLLPLFAGDNKTQIRLKQLIAQVTVKLNAEPADQLADSVSESVPKRALKRVVEETNTALTFINVTVSLADKFKAQVKPDDFVFIYAKAAQGPPMPLAAVRKRVSDLPITVRLDDSMAMMPQMKLSAFPLVNIGARVSKSGSPIGQSGDFQGTVQAIDLTVDTEVKIVINTLR